MKRTISRATFLGAATAALITLGTVPAGASPQPDPVDRGVGHDLSSASAYDGEQMSAYLAWDGPAETGDCPFYAQGPTTQLVASDVAVNPDDHNSGWYQISYTTDIDGNDWTRRSGIDGVTLVDIYAHCDSYSSGTVWTRSYVPKAYAHKTQAGGVYCFLPGAGDVGCTSWATPPQANWEPGTAQ